MPRPRGGEWLADEMAALRHAGADILVCMLTARELDELGLVEEASVARAAGLCFVGLPTQDRGVPEVGAFRDLVGQLVGAVNAGKHVVVHCRMGIGRSSMVASAVLMARGWGARRAWSAVESARGLAVPDTEEQRRWVDLVMGPAA